MHDATPRLKTGHEKRCTFALAVHLHLRCQCKEDASAQLVQRRCKCTASAKKMQVHCVSAKQNAYHCTNTLYPVAYFQGIRTQKRHLTCYVLRLFVSFKIPLFLHPRFWVHHRCKGRSHWCALHLVSYGQRCIRRKEVNGDAQRAPYAFLHRRCTTMYSALAFTSSMYNRRCKKGASAKVQRCNTLVSFSLRAFTSSM